MSESAQNKTAPAVIKSNTDTEIAARCRQYILDNPLKSASATILSWGGLLLLIFFLNIGFMPDVNLESISSLLYAIALLGGFIAVYSALMMVLPGLAMAELRFTLRLGHLLVVAAGVVISWFVYFACLFGLYSEFVGWVVFGTTLLLTPLVCFLLDVFKPIRSHHADSDTSTQKGETPIIKSVTPTSNKYKRYQSLLSSEWKTYSWASFMLALINIIMAIPLAFIGIIGLTNSTTSFSRNQTILILVALVALLAFSAALIGGISKSNQRFKVASFFAVAILFLVMFAFGGPAAFSVIAVKSLGQGEINAARIAITGKTCKEVNQTLGKRVCINVPDDEITAICPVRIRSRIGSQALLEFAPMIVEYSDDRKSASWILSADTPPSKHKKTQNLMRRVVLEKSKMLGWQPLQDFGSTSTNIPSNAIALPIASFIDDTKDSPNNAHKPTEIDPLIEVLRNRCGDAHPSAKSMQPEAPETNHK